MPLDKERIKVVVKNIDPDATVKAAENAVRVAEALNEQYPTKAQEKVSKTLKGVRVGLDIVNAILRLRALRK